MSDSTKKKVPAEDFFRLVKAELKNNGKVRFTVTGTSMLPWIGDGRDQVLLAFTDGKGLKAGDIILFQDRCGKWLLHRIYRKEAGGYRTIGDASLVEDGMVYSGQIAGVVEKIYRKGKEIHCGSRIWRFIFFIWRKLFFLRKFLMRIYVKAAKFRTGRRAYGAYKKDNQKNKRRHASGDVQ
ncbi:MAG: S24/S26 family peptidase [Clostridiaceae bacterium]